jgi:hypothetical protein
MVLGDTVNTAERLSAKPWLERADALGSAVPA